MAVPRNRNSNARKNTRRAHFAKSAVAFVGCSKCGEKKQPHRICQSCGSYGARTIFSDKDKA